MTILVTGATGTVGSQVLARLSKAGASVRGLTRSPDKAGFPAGVSVVHGDLTDVDSMRLALQGVTTLFLLVPADPDELTQVLNTLTLAKGAGVKGVVYLSGFRSAGATDVPNFIAKHVAERMIDDQGIPATIIRASYFFQNDVLLKGALQGPGVYPGPIGEIGVSMVDVGDIAEASAIELLRREQAADALPSETYEIAGPDVLTGSALTAIWSDVLGRDIRYGGNDLDAFEKQLRAHAPSWKAFTLRQMFRFYQVTGATATPADVERLTTLLGRPPRSYRDFAIQTAKAWQA